MTRRAFDTRGNLADQLFRCLETAYSDVLEHNTVPATFENGPRMRVRRPFSFRASGCARGLGFCIDGGVGHVGRYELACLDGRFHVVIDIGRDALGHRLHTEGLGIQRGRGFQVFDLAGR